MKKLTNEIYLIQIVDTMWNIEFSPDGLTAALTPNNGSNHNIYLDHDVYLLDATTGEQRHTLEGRYNLSIAFSPNGQLAVTYSLNDKIRLWDVNSGELLKTIQGDKAIFGANEQTLIVYDQDEQVLIKKSDVKQTIHSFQGHWEGISGDGSLIARPVRAGLAVWLGSSSASTSVSLVWGMASLFAETTSN